MVVRFEGPTFGRYIYDLAVSTVFSIEETDAEHVRLETIVIFVKKFVNGLLTIKHKKVFLTPFYDNLMDEN